MKNMTDELARVMAKAMAGLLAITRRRAPQYGTSRRQRHENPREMDWQRESGTAAIRARQKQAIQERKDREFLDRRKAEKAIRKEMKRRGIDGQS